MVARGHQTLQGFGRFSFNFVSTGVLTRLPAHFTNLFMVSNCTLLYTTSALALQAYTLLYASNSIIPRSPTSELGSHSTEICIKLAGRVPNTSGFRLPDSTPFISRPRNLALVPYPMDVLSSRIVCTQAMHAQNVVDPVYLPADLAY